jgi:hypothetical protein
MNEQTILAIITFIVIIAIIIWNFWRIFWKNYFNNLYDNCVKNLYINCNNDEMYLYIFTFNKKIQYKIFYDLEKLVEFKKEFKKDIFDVEMLKINSYDNYIQLE